MFLTLIFQYLNKLVKSKVRHFPTPKPFHTIKVQRFKNDHIKTPAKVGGKFPLKIKALMANPSIEACKLTDTPPPTSRTFLFSRKCFVESAKFSQGLFQELWRLYLFACAQCQKSVFHTEVRPNAFTCCWQRVGIYKVRCYAKPIVTDSITPDRHASDRSVPVAVFEKGIRQKVILPFLLFWIPLFQIQHDTVRCYLPPRLSRERNRLEFMFRFNMGFATEFLEKTLIRRVNAFEFLLHRLTRQCIPMRVCRLFQIGQMSRHGIIVGIRQSILIALALPLMEIRMHLPHIVKEVSKPNTIRLFAELILIGFHGISSIKSLTPAKWVGRHIVKRQCFACLPT